jgi:hypothetical protein
MTAVPAAAGVGVRIKVDRWIYCSKRMPLDEAKRVAAEVKRLIRGFAGLVDLPDFPCESPHLEQLAIVGDKVCAVEVRNVNGDGRAVHELGDEPCL